ncbi:MAG: DM13 domain-containing protein [Alphaproteobacteria bacterium]
MKPIWKYLAVFLVGGALGTGVGFAAGIFVYPYIFLADVVANERLDPAGRAAVATGGFIHADPSDPVHYGKGGVTVYGDAVHLASDFEVGPGPKYHVYLVPKAPILRSGDLDGEKFVDLGRLRAFKGSQVYDIPPGVDPARYGSVVIWCETFGVLISPATLAKL